MRHRQIVVSGASVTRLFGVALLAGSAAACSSDANRFSSRNMDQLTTASVPAPAIAPLVDVGAAPGQAPGYGGAYPQAGAYPQSTYPQMARSNPQAYPQAPASVSQAFPGDYRSPSQPGYDPTATGSVPGSVARAAASPSGLIDTGMRQPAPVARQVLPQPALAPQTDKWPAAPVANRSVQRPVVASPSAAPAADRPVALAPASQPFPEKPRQGLVGTVPVNPNYAANAAPVMAPDPIVTGSAPQGAGWTTTGGTRITLGPGETIYNLSKRYGVPASEIMKANGIADASKVPAGQQLLIPVYVYSRQAPVSAPDNNPKTRAANSGTGLQGEAKQDRVPLPAPAPHRDAAVLPNAPALRGQGKDGAAARAVTETAANAKTTGVDRGVYEVKGGDTLTKIARMHGVSIDALKAANELSGSNIRIGQKLAIPGANAAEVDRTSTASVRAEPKPKPYTPPVSGDSVAAKTKSDVASAAPAASGIDKFRWPARGQVITGFGQNENGKRNDGIDISMPAGTPIKAAENGVVIYSGDGLKEYGKTVLIRHDDGLVTVYAHANQLNVSRGDKVARGQVIASSGMTGVAKTPRLHFEVRKNATPVNPANYLE